MSISASYKHVLKLQFFRQAGFISVFVTMIMVIISLGVAIGFTYIHGDPDGYTTLFLATAAPTIVCIMTGLVLLPTQNVSAKSAGYTEFLRTLPVNRVAIILADATIWTLATIPGIIIALVVTHFMFGPGFEISIWALPAYLLVVLTCIVVGYGYSFALPAGPAMTISQVLAFAALMFSPINFPADRLPTWLQIVHRVLPIESMAEIMRAALAGSVFEVSIFSVAKVIAWCVGGLAVSVWVLNRK